MNNCKRSTFNSLKPNGSWIVHINTDKWRNNRLHHHNNNDNNDDDDDDDDDDDGDNNDDNKKNAQHSYFTILKSKRSIQTIIQCDFYMESLLEF